MVGEDKSTGEPIRIRMPAVDLQHFRYASAVADHESFGCAAEAPLHRHGSHPARCLLEHLRTKLIFPRYGFEIQLDRGIRSGEFKNPHRQQRRLEGLANGGNACGCFLPDRRTLGGYLGVLDQATLHRVVPNNEPVSMNPKQDRSSNQQLLRS